MHEKVRILIVEDDQVIAHALQKSLQSEGFEVVAVCDNGAEALAIFAYEIIDLALLDIHIKGNWDGIETAVQLKKQKDIPFIFVTSSADDDTFYRSKTTQPSAYLMKPFRINDLRKAIELAMYNFGRDISPLLVKKKTLVKKENRDQDCILHFNNAIFIKQNYKYNRIPFNDILYLKAGGNHTYIQTAIKRHIIKYSLQNIIDIFNTDKFVRVHRSYAINMAHLTSFTESVLFLSLEEIPIGRNYKNSFLQVFKQL